jgi:diguanylate cyclase (GGDEF)-like protein/PAS domain S-box-containing protein
MNALHNLLKRQLRRFADETLPLLEEHSDFLQAINDAYYQFDEDRKMLEHSLELTSQELLEKNAQLSDINAELEKRVAARTAELSRSEARFRGLFEHAPLSIWEEDFSAVRKNIDDLRASGVEDLAAYFAAHPEFLAESAKQVKIVDVNRATLEMFQAESKAELLADLSKILGPESLKPFKEELLALAGGETSFENETVNYTIRGERRVVFVRLTVAPGYEQTWAKVFVGISDFTVQRQAESALAAERDLLQALMDNIPDTIYFKDTSSRFTRINRAQAKVLGISKPEQAIGKTDLDFQNPELARTFFEEEQRLVQTGQSLINRIEFNPTSDGHPRWFAATKVPIKDDEGNVTSIVGISRDITERKKIELALTQSEERFKLMAWATKDAVWDWDLEANQIWWGEGLQKIFHYSAETAQPTPDWWLEHIHPEDRERVTRTINQAVQGGMEFWSKEYRFQRKDGSYADIIDRGYILRDQDGKAYRMIGAMMDITERKYMESSLRQANDQMQQVLNELQRRNHGTALLNKMGRLLQACQSSEEVYKTLSDLAGEMFPDLAGALYLLNPQRTLVNVTATWGKQPAAKQVFFPDECWALRHGRTRPLGETQAGSHCIHLDEPLPGVSLCLPLQAQGEILGILHLQSEQEKGLDEAKQQLAYIVVEHLGLALSNIRLREALREQSIRDPLTGLYNRRYMEEALRQQMSRVTRQLHPLGIVMIDIDHFKRYNDTHGHAGGDELLRALGQFLQQKVRKEDIVCRYGGEEFLLIMPDASLETARQRAEDLRQEIRKLRMQDSQIVETITLSIGIAIYPQHGRTIEHVLRSADEALYRAKRDGRDRVIVTEIAL